MYVSAFIRVSNFITFWECSSDYFLRITSCVSWHWDGAKKTEESSSIQSKNPKLVVRPSLNCA